MKAPDFKLPHSPSKVNEQKRQNRALPRGPAAKTRPSSASGAGSTLGCGARSPQVWQPEPQDTKWKQHCNEVSKDFKNRSTIENRQNTHHHKISKDAGKPYMTHAWSSTRRQNSTSFQWPAAENQTHPTETLRAQRQGGTLESR